MLFCSNIWHSCKTTLLLCNKSRLTSSIDTHIISGHRSAIGRAQDRKSLPARDRRSTAEPHSHEWKHWIWFSDSWRELCSSLGDDNDLLHSVVSFTDMTLLARLDQKQVAQLWQRDRAQLDTFLINVQRYSQNHAQSCISGPPFGPCKRLFCPKEDVSQETQIYGNPRLSQVYGLSEVYHLNSALMCDVPRLLNVPLRKRVMSRMVQSLGKLSSWTAHSALTGISDCVCLYSLHLCITQSISRRDALATETPHYIAPYHFDQSKSVHNTTCSMQIRVKINQKFLKWPKWYALLRPLLWIGLLKQKCLESVTKGSQSSSQGDMIR